RRDAAAVYVCICVLLRVFLSVLSVSVSSGLYPLSLHDALPISHGELLIISSTFLGDHPFLFLGHLAHRGDQAVVGVGLADDPMQDRKSTRLNSSHVSISYAVFCLKKKKKNSYCKRSQ